MAYKQMPGKTRGESSAIRMLTSGGKKEMQGKTNENTQATPSTFGTLSQNYKGLAKDKNGKIVSFKNNNNDFRKFTEKYMLLPKSK